MSKSTFVPAGTSVNRCARLSRNSRIASATALRLILDGSESTRAYSSPESQCIEKLTGVKSSKVRHCGFTRRVSVPYVSVASTLVQRIPTSSSSSRSRSTPVVSTSTHSSASGFPFRSLSCFLMILPSNCFAIR